MSDFEQRLKRIEERLDAIEALFKPVNNGNEVAKAVQQGIISAFRSTNCDKHEDKQDSFP